MSQDKRFSYLNATFAAVSAIFAGVSAIPPLLDYWERNSPKVNTDRVLIKPTERAVCIGEWSMIAYKFCDDRNRPRYITDGRICGFEETMRQASGPTRYLSCSHPTHPIVEYKNVETVSDWSSWRRGGYNRQSYCDELRRNFETQLGGEVQWQIVKTDEKTKIEFYRQFYYRYFCEAQARWGAIHATQSSPACGEAPVETEIVKTPKTCVDPRDPYQQSQRLECGSDDFSRQYFPGSQTDKIEEALRLQIGHTPSCTSCDALRPSERSQAAISKYSECLLASGSDALGRHGNDEVAGQIHVRMVRNRLREMQVNYSDYLDSNTKLRIRVMLKHLSDDGQ
jgi:hypothetical protein